MMVVYNYLFKLCGALFPFFIIAIRIILIKTTLKSVAPDAEIINSSDKRLGFMYVGITLMRALIYGVTLLSKGETMSDHILREFPPCLSASLPPSLPPCLPPSLPLSLSGSSFFH